MKLNRKGQMSALVVKYIDFRKSLSFFSLLCTIKCVCALGNHDCWTQVEASLSDFILLQYPVNMLSQGYKLD